MGVPARDEIDHRVEMPAGAFGVLTRTCENIKGRYDATKAMRAATDAYGFTAFMIARIAKAGGSGAGRLSDLVILTTWPRDLIEAYDEARMLEASDVSDRVRATALLQWWDLRCPPDGMVRNEQRVALFEEHDMPCHLALSIAHGDGQRLTVSFSGRRERPDEMEMAQLMRISSEVVERLRLAEMMAETGRAAGASSLTGRQTEALRWVAEGKTSTETATIMGISACTVDGYLEAVLDRLDCVSRAQAVAKAIRLELI